LKEEREYLEAKWFCTMFFQIHSQNNIYSDILRDRFVSYCNDLLKIY